MWALIFHGVVTGLRRGSPTEFRQVMGGGVRFVGLIGNRLLSQLGHQKIRDALWKVGLREAHNGHFIKRLIERGPSYAINTLNDLARALNASVARVGAQPGTYEFVLPGGRVAAVVNSIGQLVTLLPV